jgi:HK97 family phage portal protein
MGVKHLLARGWQAATKSLKQFAGFVAPPYGGARNYWLPGSRVNYHAQVGDGTGSSTVAAPLFWIARTFPEAPPALWKKLNDRQEEQVLDHKILRLLEKPNEYYTGVMLWMATVMDYYVDGNAYWLKLRDGTGLPARLWWIPHWMIQPRRLPDSPAFIDYYEWYAATGMTEVDPADIVHFRFGMDPEYPQLGRSPLKSVLREVFTDDEAAAFTASLLTNMGVPGLIISPDKGVTLNDHDADAMKEYVRERFGGDKRGEAMVMSGATKVEQFGFSPEQLNLRDLRRIPEERVTAVLGVPAIVAGLGAGLDRSTFTNMGEAREAAYEAGIIPTQRILAEDIRFQLLTEFEDPHAFRFGFDLSKVRVLQEDLYRQAQRHDLLIRGGWETVAEGRRAMGLDVDEERDNVFLRMLNIASVPADGSEPTLLAANGNGNGNGTSNGHDSRALAEEVVRQMQQITP